MESPVQSSEITGEEEDPCNSTESGWTMYINSPMNDDEALVNDDDEGYDNGDGEIVYSHVGEGFQDSNSDANREGEDDSLASDASTGNIDIKSRNVVDNYDGDDGGGYERFDYKVSNLNVQKKVEKKEKKGCFMSLFKGGDSSSKGSSSRNRKTNLAGK